MWTRLLRREFSRSLMRSSSTLVRGTSTPSPELATTPQRRNIATTTILTPLHGAFYHILYQIDFRSSVDFSINICVACCSCSQFAEIARERASPEFNRSMWELAELAKSNGVRLIYRTCHHNLRFGAHCADDRIERLINGTYFSLQSNSLIIFVFDRIFVS